MKPKSLILLTALLLTALLCAAPVAADAVSYNGKTYTNYDQIYASTTLSSSEKLALVQEMAGWTEELAAYMKWKNSGGLEAYQAAVSGNSTNSTSSDYGWDEAPGDGLGDGSTNIEPEYSYQERQAYDAAYEAYQAEYATTNVGAELYALSGSGTASNPYIITTESELYSINDIGTTSTYFELGNDISISTYQFTSSYAIIDGGKFKEINGAGFTIDFSNAGIYTASENNKYAYFTINIPVDSVIKNLKLKSFKINYGFAPWGSQIFQVTQGTLSNIIIEDCIINTGLAAAVASSGSDQSTGTINNMIVLSSTFNANYNGVSNNGGYIYSGIFSTGEIKQGIYTANQNPLSVRNSISISSSVQPQTTGNYNHAVVIGNGYSGGSGFTHTNNYNYNTRVSGNLVSSNDANGVDGKTTTDISESWFKSTFTAWDWENVWQWNDETNLPELRNANNQAVPPTISSISATPSIGGQQDTYTLSVSASTTAAGGIASYQWYGRIGSSGEWTPISGATAATYQFVPGDQALGDIYFKCIITGADGGVIDSYDAGYINVKITVVLAPQISNVAANPTTGPLTQTVQLSADVTSTTTATYQWQEQIGGSWTDINGATSATYSVSIADTAATLHSYRLQATNIGGTTTSNPVTYQSVAAPAISAVSATPTTGPLTQTVQLSATVTGATAYQWQQQTGSTWVNIQGATAATYSVSIADAAATLHSYRLQATNIGGTTTSNTVSYQSVLPPAISAVSATPASGPLTQTVQLSVSATGAGSYQWQEQIGGSWTDISGATSTTVSVNIADSAPTLHTYRVIVTGIGGTVTSSEVTYQSSQGPLITNAAANPTTGPLTQTVQLSATVSSDYAISYQWQEQVGSSWENIAGATSASFAVSVADSVATLHPYRLLATDVGGTTPSAVVTYQSVAPPVVSAASASPALGTFTETVQLSATVSGADSLQWQEQVGSSWENIAGATSASFAVSVADSVATLHQYRLQASNVGGVSFSSVVMYQSVAPPVFSSVSVSPTSGAMPLTVSYSAEASDTSGYRWEYSTGGTVWMQMASGASGSYTFTDAGTYSVRVVATGTGGQSYSDVVSVSVIDYTPVFESVSVTPTAGVVPFSVTFTASATNSPDYVWEQRQGNSWVAVGFGSPFTLSIPYGTETGTLSFRAQASNDYGTAVSDVLTVSVGAPPRAEIIAPVDGATAAVNRAVSFSAYSAPGVAYSWDFGDGSSGSGSTVTHYYSEEGMYSVTLTATNQYGSSTDNLRLYVIVPTGEIFVTATDVSSSGVELTATVETTPVDAGTLVWFELESMSGTVVYKSPQFSYSGPVSYTASGLPLMAGESYRAVAYSNYYGYSIPVQVTLVDAVQPPHELLGNAWNDGLNREPFDVSALVAAGVGVYGGALGGGAVGAAVAFGVIVMFVLVGLWLRQQDIVIPLTLTLIAGWFVIGNLPGDWQPIAYTLMVVCVVAIFFYLFRKRIE